MTKRETRHEPLDVLILDYNGVIGLQPDAAMWTYLADLAGWPADQLHAFRTAFWSRRAAYDAGELSDHDFWSGLLRDGRTAPPGSILLDTLRRTDTAMWTRTDPAVIDLLHGVHAAGTPIVLLSNAPHPLADELDRTAWCSTLITKTVYSARLGVNKPHPLAYEAALAAIGWPSPDKTLFVDDRLDNCDAAAQLGLRTLHFTGDPVTLSRYLPRPTHSARPAIASNTA